MKLQVITFYRSGSGCFFDPGLKLRLSDLRYRV